MLKRVTRNMKRITSVLDECEIEHWARIEITGLVLAIGTDIIDLVVSTDG